MMQTALNSMFSLTTSRTSITRVHSTSARITRWLRWFTTRRPTGPSCKPNHAWPAPRASNATTTLSPPPELKVTSPPLSFSSEREGPWPAWPRTTLHVWWLPCRKRSVLTRLLPSLRSIRFRGLASLLTLAESLVSDLTTHPTDLHSLRLCKTKALFRTRCLAFTYRSCQPLRTRPMEAWASSWCTPKTVNTLFTTTHLLMQPGGKLMFKIYGWERTAPPLTPWQKMPTRVWTIHQLHMWQWWTLSIAQFWSHKSSLASLRPHSTISSTKPWAAPSRENSSATTIRAPPMATAGSTAWPARRQNLASARSSYKWVTRRLSSFR